jgi:transitional endoplasmic reticulum ATPase
MTSLLDQAMEHLQTAAEQRHARHNAAARRHYLKSAECLLKSAAESVGPMRETRRRQAEQLADIARRLAGTSRLEEKRGAEPVAVDEGGRTFLLRETPEVSFDDVAGLEAAKQQIYLRLIYPLNYPEKAARYGKKQGGGLLLCGPPGTGKTLLARATAGQIQVPFLTAKPSELMSKWVGEAEQNIAHLFEEARRYPRAVIFLDEVESLIPTRRSSGSTVMQRVVPQILAEMDGVHGKRGALLFVGATNEPWAIDRAAIRPGRFDAKVYVGLPEQTARRQILEMCLADKPLAGDVALEALATQLDGYSGADIAELCERCTDEVFLESIRTGEDRSVTQADIQAALSTSRPSVLPKDLRKYEQWAQEN